MNITPTAMEVLGQLFINGPTWDGNLISKEGRSELVEKRYVDRWEGWNWLTELGVQWAVQHAKETKNWHDRRWYEKGYQIK